jgi:curli production assembly/transport component CsgE
MRHPLFPILLICISIQTLKGQQDYKAWVEITHHENTTNLLAKFLNQTPKILPITFELSVKKTGKNHSTNSQKGGFEAMPNEPITLSKNTINLEKNEQCEIHLRVFHQDQMIAEELLENVKNNDHKALPPQSSKHPNSNRTRTPPSPSSQHSIQMEEIDGLLINKTRTKHGKDFYDLFFRQWEIPQGVHGIMMTIEEKPGRGRGSMIVFHINNRQIMTKWIQPNRSLLEQIASNSVAQLRYYLINNFDMQSEILGQF